MLKTGCKNVVGNIALGCQQYCSARMPEMGSRGGGAYASKSVAPTMLLASCFQQPVKADFHSVQNVAQLIFSDHFLLICVKSTTANEICSA